MLERFKLEQGGSAMKRSFEKIKNTHRVITRKIRSIEVPRAADEKITRSLSSLLDRSKDFVSTLPTLNELREEFADWHSFEPIAIGDLSVA